MADNECDFVPDYEEDIEELPFPTVEDPRGRPIH